VYHITARGTGRMTVFVDDEDHLTFVDRLAEVVEDCHLVCLAYCLMANHYHLVVRTVEANISRAVHRLNGPYAQWWNVRRQRTGHVFQGRFGAQVVDDDAYLLTACRYVVLNPVRAGLVQDPGDWRWSSYRATAALGPVPQFLSPDVLWRCFGDNATESTTGSATESATERYRRFVSADLSGHSRIPTSRVVGSLDFISRFESMTRAARDQSATAAYTAGYCMAEIARFLDLHPSTVSKMIERHKERSGVRP
jgi:REP element-mobilizing transposase RayT